MKPLVTITALATFGSVAHAQVRHVPPGEAEAGKPLELVAQAAPTTPTLVAHVRVKGAEWKTIELVRNADASWVAVVPAETIEPPGIDYYLTSGDKVVFASPEWPHSLAVTVPPDEERRARDTIRSHGRRSKVQAMGEWVNYGRKHGQQDNYYRVDADFAYRLWTYPLEEIRVGYTRLLGDTLQPSQMCPTPEPCSLEAGARVAGWFELGLAAVEGVRFDARVIVMANKEGFAVGGTGPAGLRCQQQRARPAGRRVTASRGGRATGTDVPGTPGAPGAPSTPGPARAPSSARARSERPSNTRSRTLCTRSRAARALPLPRPWLLLPRPPLSWPRLWLSPRQADRRPRPPLSDGFCENGCWAWPI